MFSLDKLKNTAVLITAVKEREHDNDECILNIMERGANRQTKPTNRANNPKKQRHTIRASSCFSSN